MANEPNPSAAKPDTAPTAVKMPRAVHELQTGPKPEQKIDAGTIITDTLAKTHKLTDEGIEALKKTGAIDHVDVFKG